MRGADQTFPEDRRTLTRRELLVRAVAFGAAGILEALVACGPPPGFPIALGDQRISGRSVAHSAAFAVSHPNAPTRPHPRAPSFSHLHSR